MTSISATTEQGLPATFTHQLLEQHRSTWEAVVQHRFVDELLEGRVDDAVMARYLVQDYQFLNHFVALLGAAIASADSYAARVRLVRFAAMVTSDESTYFMRAFDALHVPPQQRTHPPLCPATRAFQNLMQEAAQTQSYAMCLSVLVVAEWSYASWAMRARSLPENFVHAQWVELHNNPQFLDFVDWLRTQLDAAGPLLDEAGQQRCATLFGRAVQLERDFFDAAYQQ